MKRFIFIAFSIAVPFLYAMANSETNTGIMIHRWLGAGKTAKWSDKSNWAQNQVPSFFSFSTAISFDAENGKHFGFGGDDFEMRIGSIFYPTNAGSYAVSAPIFTIGGSVNENRDDGYILENIYSPGLIENHSDQTQTLKGARLRIGWDTTIETINGDVVLKGGADGPNYRIYKHGPNNLTIADGKIDLKAISFNEGNLVLSNVTGSILNDNSFSTNFTSMLSVKDGAHITVGNTNVNDVFYLRHQFNVSGENESGEPCLIDFQNRNLAIFSKDFKVDSGIIENAGHIRLLNGWSGERYTFEFTNGAELSCKGMFVGVADRNFGQTGCSNVTLRVTGGPKDTPTTLNLNGGDLLLGTLGGWGDRFSGGSNTVEVIGNSRIIGINKLHIPADGSRNSRFIVNDGAKLETGLFWFGFRGSCTTGIINGKDTRVEVINNDFTVGYSDWGNSISNILLTVSNGAVLNSKPTLYVGQTPSTNTENCPATNVVVRVINGGKLRSNGAVIGHATRGKNSSNAVDNKLLISGDGSAWESTGSEIIVGNALSSIAHHNSIVIQDQARVLCRSQIIVGYGRGRPSTNNRFRLLSGSVLRTESSIVVGKNNNSDNQNVSENVFEMRGTPKALTILQLENKNITIGYSDNRNRPANNNRFILGPYSEIRGVASINIGMEKNSANVDNAIVLAGGSALIENLTIASNNCIELDLGNATKPLLVNQNIFFGEGVRIKVINTERAKPGQYPVLAWKGECTGIDNIKLDPSMDASRWVLDVRKDRKQIVLYYKN